MEEEEGMLDQAVGEALAAYAHNAWSGWITYMFEKGARLPTGELVIPSWAVERWDRQRLTPYEELPEIEKFLDREESVKILSVFNDHIR